MNTAAALSVSLSGCLPHGLTCELWGVEAVRCVRCEVCEVCEVWLEVSYFVSWYPAQPWWVFTSLVTVRVTSSRKPELSQSSASVELQWSSWCPISDLSRQHLVWLYTWGLRGQSRTSEQVLSMCLCGGSGLERPGETGSVSLHCIKGL